MPVKHLAGDIHLNLRHSGKLQIAPRYTYAQKQADTVSTVSPSISHEVMGPDAMIFIF